MRWKRWVGKHDSREEARDGPGVHGLLTLPSSTASLLHPLGLLLTARGTF